MSIHGGFFLSCPVLYLVSGMTKLPWVLLLPLLFLIFVRYAATYSIHSVYL